MVIDKGAGVLYTIYAFDKLYYHKHKQTEIRVKNGRFIHQKHD